MAESVSVFRLAFDAARFWRALPSFVSAVAAGSLARCPDVASCAAALDLRPFDFAGLAVSDAASFGLADVVLARLGACFFSLALGELGFAALPSDAGFSSDGALSGSAAVLLLASSKGLIVLARSGFAACHDISQATGRAA
ncbi:MAG: hypothetical protein AAFW76_07215 [Pseudomonadota bacterium]